MPEVNYSEYLSLDTLLGAQRPESEKHGVDAHDETLFIITHQAYELWFKQVLFEVESVCGIMQQPAISDNSPELQTVAHRLKRIVTILRLLVHQIEVMETMSPMDFLDFRDLLRPASGFQSWQFKLIEARLGLRFEERAGGHHYTSQLKPHEIDIIHEGEAKTSLLDLVNRWLERMPEFEPGFIDQYESIYSASLVPGEEAQREAFHEMFMRSGSGSRLSPKAARAALFITLYCGYPVLQLPYQLLQTLLEIDEQLSTWRYRHMHMVSRVIGARHGTGGSSGAGYLKSALDRHYIFRDIARLNSFLVERSKLPALPKEVEATLGFGAMQ